MKNVAYLIVFFTFVLMISCGKSYDDGSLPVIPTNLTAFNSEHDDYNSSAPSLGEVTPFCFSTNRNSLGANFDIIYMPMNVDFNTSSGELNITNDYTNWTSKSGDLEIVKLGINKIRTVGNEFGPNLIVENTESPYTFTLMYSSDVSGNSQINFTSNRNDENFSEPKEVAFLNTEFEDLYPCFSSTKSEIYFCSNRDGENFNFYFVDVNPDTDSESLLSDTAGYEVKLESVLSSDSNDKCPFIFGNKMVFSSDRPGGFGGYDLYFSNFVNGEWMTPTNFGESINSAFDEFRPILLEDGASSEQTMMVFSSDRTGGLGGFDLYFVGIDKD